MQSDPWWSLAMAINVFAVFFYAASPNSFRSYLWVYALICYGLPALPAIICALVRPGGVGIYGNATVSPPLCSFLASQTKLTLAIVAAMVLDRRSVQFPPYIYVLSPRVGMHIAVRGHLCCRWVSCLSPAKPAAQSNLQQPCTRRVGI